MTNKWWDRYDHEPHVLMEDVGRSHQYLGDFLKIWADRYPFAVEVKHGGMVIRPYKLVITSNYSIEQLWPEEEICEPLKRRFKVINLVQLHKYDTSPVTGKSPRYREQDGIILPAEPLINDVDHDLTHDAQLLMELVPEDLRINEVPHPKCDLCDDYLHSCECTRCLICLRLLFECNCDTI